MVQGLGPGFVLGFILLDITIILVVARLMGHLANKVGQPRVVGEIIAGVLLGPTLLGVKLLQWDNAPAFLHCDASRSWMPPGTDPTSFVPRVPSISHCIFPLQAQGTLSVIGQLALILFMFLVGMELDLDRLKGRITGILTLSVGVVAAPIVIGLGVGAVLYTGRFALAAADGSLPDQLAFSLFVAAMLAVTAFPVMVRILQEKGLTMSPMGVVGIASAAIVTVLMFVLLAVAKGVAADYDLTQHSRVFVGTVVYLGVMIGIIRPLLRRVGVEIRRTGGVDPSTFAILMIVAFGSSYAADRIGLNVIVGGFIAGVIMPERAVLLEEMQARLSDITITILLPIFLAFSGLRTDLTSLGVAWIPGLIVFLLAGIAAKWGAGAVFARIGGLRWSEANLLGVLMNCRGLLVLVVGLEAASSGLITSQLQAAGVLMALITTAMTGPLVSRFLPSVSPPSDSVVSGSVAAPDVKAAR